MNDMKTDNSETQQSKQLTRIENRSIYQYHQVCSWEKAQHSQPIPAIPHNNIGFYGKRLLPEPQYFPKTAKIIVS